ncbi:hypothetical protein DXT99_01800 [Pontibacter diazotrophicus]|uniref:Uncharacterized protein n=1 Tax=Pontibacter diazotrophicus TaxID=1400979 RepID=A0A3D8LIX4_9BACT|nr:hypothetical protein [Pontibacter diazotrophicus]RDV16872.1 hypothetical protein DXT99_01800 [Pontibacter diazotrophicus]
MNNAIEYYLPERVFKLTVKFLVKQELTYNENYEVIKIKLKDCYIQDDLLLEPLLHPVYTHKYIFDYSKYRSFWYQLSFEAQFDEEGAGILQSINIESTPVVKEIISGVVDVASSLIKLGTGTFLTAPPAEAELIKVETIERTLTETYLIKIGDMESEEGGYSLTLPKPVIGDSIFQVPTIEVFIKPNQVFEKEQNTANVITSKEGIFYREPVLSNIKVKVLNNGSIKEQNVIDEYSFFPQFGKIMPLKLTAGNILNKAGSKVSFSKTTGGIEKFSLTTESTIKETLDSSHTSVNAINTLVGELQNIKKEKAAKTIEKNKAEIIEKEAKVKAEDDKELESLKREKEILDRQKEIIKIKHEIAKLKQEAASNFNQ